MTLTSPEGFQTLRISGMTCASCVSTIERALMATPGVTHASVNLATGTARVQAVAEIPREALVNAVHGSGYKVVADGNGTQARTDDRDSRAASRRWSVALALTIPLVAIAMGPHLLGLVGMGDAGMDNDMQGMSSMGEMSAMPGRAGMEGMDMRPASMANASDGMDTMQYTTEPSTVSGQENGSMDSMEGMDMESMGMMDMGSSDQASDQGMDGMDMGGSDGGAKAPASSQSMDGMGMKYAWLQLILATPVVLYSGSTFFQGAWNALRHRSLTMDTLVATGMGTAYGYSTAVTLIPSWASSAGLYFETAAVIVTLVLLGRRIEHRAMKRARASLERLTVDAANAGLGRFVMDAQGSRATLQRAVDRVVRFFVPTILVIAFASFLFWLTLGAPIAMQAGLAPQTMALLTLITVLIIACPCALGLATPMAVMAGTGRGAEQGLFIKGAAAVDAAGRIETVVLTKTGVLTTGAFELTDVIALRGSEADVLTLAGAAEAKSDHPLAIAIHRRAQSLHPTGAPAAQSFEHVPGSGVKAVVDGSPLLVGRPEWLATQGVAFTSPKAARRLRAQGKTVVGVAKEGVLVGLLGLADTIQPSAKRAVAQVQHRGLKTILLTGDHERAAQTLAASLGIDQVRAGVSPARKGEAIRSLRADGHRVAVIGAAADDAEALREANLGIALGGGQDEAKEAAGIILAGDTFLEAGPAMDLARRTSRKVHQNLAWAFAYNVLLVPVAAGLLVAWPLFGKPIALDPMFGAAAMTLSILSVIANSLSLRKWKPMALSIPGLAKQPEATSA